VLGDGSRVSDIGRKQNKTKHKEASLSLPKDIMHSTYTLEHALIFLKCMISEHIFVNLVPLNINLSPRCFLDVEK
jgi:hypothetical protein